MAWTRVFSAVLVSVLVAAATGIASLGFLAVFHPFELVHSASPATAPADRAAMRRQVDALRDELSETRAALSTGTSEPSRAAPEIGEVRSRYEEQIAAATERRDLALRQARAIRNGLAAGADVSALAGIRDSAIVGQLLAQRGALEAQLEEQAARLRPAHPTMRALTAQGAALATQIRAQAASIASALEAEAKLDQTQIDLLQSQLPALTTGSLAPVAPSDLQQKAASQEAQLEALTEAYLALPDALPIQSAPNSAGILSLANLLVLAVATLAALLFQVLVAVEGRRRRRASDLAAWRDEADTVAQQAAAAQPELRRAS